MSGIEQITYNVLGGIVVAVLTALSVHVWTRLYRWRFTRLFGADSLKDGEYSLVFGTLQLPPSYDSNGNAISHPYIKPHRNDPAKISNTSFSVEKIISSCEVRGINYLASMFASDSWSKVSLTGDAEITKRLDL